MPRSFDLLVESPASVEHVHSTFSDQEYWLARLAACGGIGKLDSFTVGADGSAAVTMTHDLRQDWLPGLVAMLYPRDLRVVHKETWRSIGGGQVRGEVSIAACGAPGSGLGVAFLTPRQNGSHLKFTATVEFKVPLVGGKIESYIGRQVIEGIAEINRFTTAWIKAKA